QPAACHLERLIDPGRRAVNDDDVLAVAGHQTTDDGSRQPIAEPETIPGDYYTHVQIMARSIGRFQTRGLICSTAYGFIRRLARPRRSGRRIRRPGPRWDSARVERWENLAGGSARLYGLSTGEPAT